VFKHFNKILTIVLITVFLASAGFGCKGLSTEEKQAMKKVKLEYWTVNDDVDELRKIINEFKAVRPYIEVTLRQVRKEELYPRLIEELAEDKGPDIISVNNKQLSYYQSKLSSMPPAVQDTTVKVIDGKLRNETIVNKQNIPMPNVNQVDREYVKAVKEDVVKGGKIYGLPLSLDTMAIYYNKDLLDRSGVAQPPKNWVEFQKAVKKITKYDSDGKVLQAGTAMGLGSNVKGFDDILYMLFEQSGLKFTDSNGYMAFGGNSRSLAKSTLKVMNFYTDYANKNKDVYSWDSNMGNSLEEFIRGKVGFYFGYKRDMKTIKSQAPQLNVRVMPMLQLNESKKFNSADYWVQSVVKKSEHKNEAWNLVNFLTHSKATKKYLDATKRPTALRAYINEQKKDPELKPFASQVLIAENWYEGKEYKKAQKALSDLLYSWINVPEKINNPGGYYSDILYRAVSRINQGIK